MLKVKFKEFNKEHEVSIHKYKFAYDGSLCICAVEDAEFEWLSQRERRVNIIPRSPLPEGYICADWLNEQKLIQAMINEKLLEPTGVTSHEVYGKGQYAEFVDCPILKVSQKLIDSWNLKE